MGLDSVELLITFEKTFGIQVPDLEAEQLTTVGEVSTWFHQHLTDSPVKSTIQKVIKEKTYLAISAIGLNNDFALQDPVQSIFHVHKLPNQWESFEKEMDLKIPKLNRMDLNYSKEKAPGIINRLLYKQRPAVTSHSFERLIEWIGALNYCQFIQPRNATSIFDVFIIVSSLTHQQCGIAIDEIFWNSSFTSDLGID